jgi:hypothetical protein
MDAEVYYDPYDCEIDSDPYPVWKRLRDEQPLYCHRHYPYRPGPRRCEAGRSFRSSHPEPGFSRHRERMHLP